MQMLDRLHRVMKNGYRHIAPTWLRGSRTANALKTLLYRFLPKGVIYDHDFLSTVIDQPATSAATVIAASVIRDFSPESILDVGCGSGAMLSGFCDSGLTAKGFEFADPALALCAERQLDVMKVDLRSPDTEHLPRGFDIVLSMEVAEHLPRKSAAGYVELLCTSAPVVIFTAAPPGQGGTDHVNEQPMAYWTELFKQHAFYPAVELADTWRHEWTDSGKVAEWYTNNLMIFRSLGPCSE